MDKNQDRIKGEDGYHPAILYLTISLGVTLAFILAASLGGHPLVTEIGGTVWVGLLCIYSVPIITTCLRRKLINSKVELI